MTTHTDSILWTRRRVVLSLLPYLLRYPKFADMKPNYQGEISVCFPFFSKVSMHLPRPFPERSEWERNKKSIEVFPHLPTPGKQKARATSYSVLPLSYLPASIDSTDADNNYVRWELLAHLAAAVLKFRTRRVVTSILQRLLGCTWAKQWRLQR